MEAKGFMKDGGVHITCDLFKKPFFKEADYFYQLTRGHYKHEGYAITFEQSDYGIKPTKFEFFIWKFGYPKVRKELDIVFN